MKIGHNLYAGDGPLWGADELALFLGAVPGSWTHRLIELYASSDMFNQRRLGLGFPALLVIYETWGRDYSDTDTGSRMPPRPLQLDAALADIYGIDWRYTMPEGADRVASDISAAAVAMSYAIPAQRETPAGPLADEMHPLFPVNDPTCRCGHPLSLHLDDTGPCTGEPGAPANTWCDCTGYVGPRPGNTGWAGIDAP